MADVDWIGSGPVVPWRETLGALRVLQQEQYEAHLSAEAITAAARQEEQEIITAARRNAENTRNAAHREGLEAGQAEGQRNLDRIGAKWSVIAERFERGLEQLIRSQRELIVTYAALLAGRVLETNLEDREAFHRHLDRILAEDSGKRCLALYVHPQRVKELVAAKSHFPALSQAVVEQDRTLGLADLRLQYESHRADGRLYTILDTCAAVLLREVLIERESNVRDDARQA